jgi:tetratricopeptide (TPR) repeat protein
MVRTEFLTRCFYLVSTIVGLLGSPVFSDDSFNRLIQAKKYSEAVSYADANIPPGARTVDIWIKVGFANEELGLLEKALASYIVGSRIDPKSYDSYLGIARIYNGMDRPENALTYAKKAMDLRPAGPASWEYAKACLTLKKPEQAKDALEKVVEFDPTNAVANKGLAEIYWKEKAYEKAIPLLKIAYASNPNPEDAFRIGKSLNEANKYDSAVYFLKEAVSKNPSLLVASLELARAFFQKSKYLAAASEYEKIAGKTPFMAIDHYYRAVSNDKTGNAEGAMKAYRAAAEEFGAEKTPEAIAAHLKVGAADIEAKNYSSALPHLLAVAAASDSEDDQALRIQFMLADAYAGTGNLPKAIATLEKALSVDKNNVEAYARLADLYQKNNQPDKAKVIFEKCLTLKPNDPKIFLVLGEYNLKAKKYEDALTYYGKSYVIQNSGEAAAGMAGAAFALGKTEKALDAAESALRLSPTLVEPRIVLYKSYMKSKGYKEAREHLNFLVDNKPLELEYWKSLAECCMQLKDSARCADADKKIIEMEKNNVSSRLRYGAYLLSIRDYAKALPVFKDLAVLTPQSADVFKSLYTITNSLGDKQAALTHMKKYCALRPNDVTAQKYIGGVYYDLKNYDAALDAFRKIVKNDPTTKGIYKPYVQIVISKGLTEEIQSAIIGAIATGEADGAMYAALAGVYQKQGLIDKAIIYYQKASEMDPRNVSLISALAKCNEKAGHLDEAAIYYGQVLALNPSATEDYKTLGNLLVKRNKKGEAVDAFKKYLEKNKSDNALARFVADFAYAQKNYAEATRYFALINGEEAKKPDVLFNYGQACFNLKNFKKASDLLTQLASITPQNPEVFKLLSLIASQDISQKGAAADYLAKYLALKPSDAASQRTLGDMLYERKDMSGALKAYRKAIAAEPSMKGIYKRYYELAANQGSAADIEAALSGADNAGEVDAGMYAQLGSIFEKKTLYSKALGYYQKAQQMDPTNTAVTSSIARCQVKSGKMGDAILTYQQVVALNPKAVEEYKILGELLRKQNKPDQAVAEYKNYLAKKPSDPEIAMFVAENAFKYNDYNDAVKYLGGIEKEKSHDVTYLFLYGKACYHISNYKKTCEIFEQIRSMESGTKKFKNLDRAALLRMLAESYEKLGENTKAVAAYAEYTRLPDVKDPEIFFKMAQMQEAISPIAAAGMYERNTIKFPKEYRNYYEAARLYSKQNATFDKAVTLLKKCVALKDTVPFLWQVLGRLYGQMGKTSQELDAYRKYIQKDTPSADVCEDIGTSLFKRNMINESIVYLELACALSPENPDFLYQLARGYEKTNRLSDAIPLLKKADQLKPGQEKIQTFLNYVLLRSGATN